MRMIFFMNVDRRGEQTVEGQLGFVPPRKLCTDREQVGVLVGIESMYVTRVLEGLARLGRERMVRTSRWRAIGAKGMSRGHGVVPGRL